MNIGFQTPKLSSTDLTDKEDEVIDAVVLRRLLKGQTNLPYFKVETLPSLQLSFVCPIVLLQLSAHRLPGGRSQMSSVIQALRFPRLAQ